MKIVLTAAACALIGLPAAACSVTQSNQSDSGQGSTTVKVTSSDSSCELSSTQAPSGKLTFAISNSGSKVTEFYLYAQDGKRVVAELENIGPGLTRNVVVSAKPGTYVSACKPGMEGDGIRANFTVTG